MPAFRPDQIVIHPDTAKAYAEMEVGAKAGRKEEAAIWKSFLKAVDRIRADGQWGEVIPRIPAYFIRRYQVVNLYCVDLAFYHRAFYTIYHRDIVLLDLVDHAQYSKWFPGRGR